ncbi:uncharacterized protein SAPINGB_P003311 [Magnusiomyces paraingens]|uniref:BZIP domain-containing protein n=1 Tax=Magnusiomyces paraingens TaxID=2606893 RepID=A0A5E8BKG2_9ASCO|nr:uncharacterized protein SAPINGB_P003311 [Saprochaete ingens]VVT52082.1 unnamed protein product [Saprochaete ingens]
MDSEFPSFQNDKMFSSNETENDLLNFYTTNFDGLSPMLDNLDFSVNSNNDTQKGKSFDVPLAMSTQRDSYNVIPGLESDGTPGSSISSLSPQSPSGILSNSTINSFEQSPSNDLNLPEKRKASVSVPSTTINSKKKQSASTKPTPKRPGRRINPNEPESKRKAQNRAAQRAFRERKERHLKDLEQRVEELENEAQETNTENEFLRKQVERLQNELRKFRNGKYSVQETGQSITPAFPDAKFTFEFPFFQGSSGPVDGENQSNEQSQLTYHNKSPSGSISSGESYNATSQLTSDTSSCGTEPKEDSFCEQLNLACGNRENPIPKYKSVNPLIISTPDVSGTSNITNDTLSASPVPKLTIKKEVSSSFELDFLSDYKDQVFDSDLLSFADSSKSISVFDSIPSVQSNTSENSIALNEPQFDSDDNDEDNEVPAPSKLMTCTAVWDRISSHPKFADLDIDGLCAELRTKAKCSESGVVLTESDVNKVLSSLK